jgi:acyl dehydratase
MKYFEDFHPGDVLGFGDKIVTEDEIIAFATEYDPQSFHINPAAATESIFGGLVASGWHTISMSCRMFVDHVLLKATSLGGHGVDEWRWLLPVRAGDRLSVRATVLETRASRTKLDRGTVRMRMEVLNQKDEAVAHYTVMAMFGTRPKGAGSAI